MLENIEQRNESGRREAGIRGRIGALPVHQTKHRAKGVDRLDKAVRRERPVATEINTKEPRSGPNIDYFEVRVVW